MVSATDFSDKLGVAGTGGTAPARPKKRRFRLFAALAAPFKDVDDRAVRKKRASGTIRNNSKGNLFATGVAAPAKPPVKRFSRGDD
jgi:hypothetical protein